VFPGFPPQGEVFRRTTSLALSYRRVFSSRVVNELTVGYGRFGFLFTQGEANPAWPDIPPFDFNTISEPYLNTPRTARWVTTPQILDNLSLVHGAHVFRTGVNFRFYRHVDQRGQPGGINVTPSVSFHRLRATVHNRVHGRDHDKFRFHRSAQYQFYGRYHVGSLINNAYARPRL
jgi:hypothetical protein